MIDSRSSTAFVDSEHPRVQTFAAKSAKGADSDRDRAIKLYYAVRDGIRYDPYNLDLTQRGLSASRTLELGRAWCVPKAVLLAACCRALGIPAKVGFADVKNHLSTKRLRERMGTDVFYWHGYSAIQLDGAWVKATPAFNIELCDRFRIKPLEFDGLTDSIYHPCDLEGRKHMEYLKFRGEFDDVPLEAMLATYTARYRRATYDSTGADFDRDVELETEGH
ncbi:MAG: transglutaminase family protein [Myxococcales bacterium]|nr:transglutaminase family protein [Myxococcales bacterium]MDH3843278.1 transglutaminase family protein [Myxococcales bacterium]